jgi:hypothetical protein
MYVVAIILGLPCVFTAYSLCYLPSTPLYHHGLPGPYHVPIRSAANRHGTNAKVMDVLWPLKRLVQ